MSAVNKTALLASQPVEWPEDLRPAIAQYVKADRRKIVVLDDDPTGTQTVWGVPVLTDWSVERLQTELHDEGSCCYVLTNSRSLPLAEAQSINAEIGRNLCIAAQSNDRPIAIVSRSDSTLRGHFPGEVDALVKSLDTPVDAWLVVPFFLEGGRYTINDVHYVAEGDALIPAGETPYAKDATFGYSTSNLCEWIAEKTGGSVDASNVASVSLADLRQGGPSRVVEKLMALNGGAFCVVNAISYRDLEVFVLGLLEAEARGKHYIYRSAASFVQVRASINPRTMLTATELALPGSANGGLFIIGSHVPKSTRQFHMLSQQPGMVVVDVDVNNLLDEAAYDVTIASAAHEAESAIVAGNDTVIVTSRQLQIGRDPDDSLAIGRRISAGLAGIVRAIKTQPRYFVTKGGITSSDVATTALEVKRAEVLGQILPGVPVWRLGPESRYPGAPFVVFPGNVGNDNALVTIHEMLRREDSN